MEIIKKTIQPASSEEVTMLATEYTNYLIEDFGVFEFKKIELKEDLQNAIASIESCRESYIEEFPGVLEQIRPTALKYEFLLKNGKAIIFYTFSTQCEINEEEAEDFKDFYGVDFETFYCLICENGDKIITSNLSDFGDYLFGLKSKIEFENMQDEKWLFQFGNNPIRLEYHEVHKKAREKFRIYNSQI